MSPDSLCGLWNDIESVFYFSCNNTIRCFVHFFLLLFFGHLFHFDWTIVDIITAAAAVDNPFAFFGPMQKYLTMIRCNNSMRCTRPSRILLWTENRKKKIFACSVDRWFQNIPFGQIRWINYRNRSIFFEFKI